MTQGQSAYTRFKEERFGPVLAQSLLISKAVPVRHYPYYHVDLNSGGGYNKTVGVAGSPLNFLWAKDRHQRHNFYAFFCDNDPIAIRELLQHPEVLAQPSTRVFVQQGDNSEVLPVVSEFVARQERNPHYSMGSILVDPNGYHKGVPWNALHTFCAAHPRFDLFFNLNVRCFWMERPHIQNGRGEWSCYQVQPISAFAQWFTRRHWMITVPVRIGGMWWVQLVGRTIQTTRSGYESLGFYDLGSGRGQRIVEFIEVPRKPADFPLLQNLLGVSPTPGVPGSADGCDAAK